MNILALDSSTEACSAALLRDDGALFGQFEIAPRQHNRLLPKMMDRVLGAADVSKTELTHCAFANGPGAFTGIRIAAAQAQGIGLALQLPLLPISTLAVLAQLSLQRLGGDRALVALDARMDQIYWAVYVRNESLAVLQGKENLSPAQDMVIDADIDCGAGHGWVDSLRARASFPLDPGLLPDARAMLALARADALAGRGIAADRIRINYLRNRVAEKSGV